MKRITLEATESCPELEVELVTPIDIMPASGMTEAELEAANPLLVKLCFCANDQVVAHTIRGRGRSKSHKVGTVYSVMEVLKSYKSGTRSGEPNEQDKKLAVAKYATPNFDFDAWCDGLVKRFPGLTLPTFDSEDEVLDIAKVYRAVRLWKPTDI